MASFHLDLLGWGLGDWGNSVVVGTLGLGGENGLELTIWLTLVEDQWDQEQDNTREWEKDSNDLPATVVFTVVWVGGVLLDGHDDEPVHSPWEDELNGEAPPELEDAGTVLAQWGSSSVHGLNGNWSDTSKEDVLVPVQEADSRNELGENEGDDDSEDVPGPNDWKTNPGLVWEAEVASPGQWEHQTEVHEHEGKGSWLRKSHGIVLAVVPSN